MDNTLLLEKWDKVSKGTKMRLLTVIIVLIADILFLPWILKFPFILIKDFANAPKLWFEYGMLKSFFQIFTDAKFRNLFLFMQVPVTALIIGILWDTHKLGKKNRIKDGVGGPEPAGAGQHGTSRWQNKREMDLSCKVWHTDEEIRKGGIVFGKDDVGGKEKIWFDDDDVHTLILGATRSGKGRKVIFPSIWEIAQAGESMVLGDPKGELYATTSEYLKKQGYNIITLNLREPMKGNQWNMLDPVIKAAEQGDIAKATEKAWDIASTIVNQTPSTQSEPIWKNGGQSTIATLILLTVLNSDFASEKHMTTAYHLLAEYGQPLADETIPLIDYVKRLPVQHPAKAAFATACIAPYKTRASFFTTALSDLRLFSDPNIGDMTSKQDHIIENIGIEKTAVFLIVPDEKTTRNVLATLYIDQVYSAMVDLANKNGGRIPRRVNMILDEFGNLPAVPEFDKKLTVAAGRGVRFTIAVQDVAQIKKLYDKNAQTIMGNCHNWIYLKTADVETAKLISEKTGKYTVETENSSSSVQKKGYNLSHGVGLAARPLLLPDEILRWDTKETLVLPISSFPARYPAPDLSQWQANKDFGFSATGNIDFDKEANRQIIQKREEEMPIRKVKRPKIWLVDLDEDYTQNYVDNDTQDEEDEIKNYPAENEVSEKADIQDVCPEIIGSLEISEESEFTTEIPFEDNKDDDDDLEFC